eukprot:TRINITY_DN6281_c0_g1_i1.p1 TRINITY_DN6281_c0_g1~~TRINITY_DN6281_c0_g1_i1.p1  ORF type:complete len:660 (+),score=165.58 TRINITY_DN6281_c0_g1_i1:128-2107(+)
MTSPNLTMEAFADDTFDVDQFVARTRTHLPLSNLQSQLRDQVQQVQSAVVELINKDYQDFVSLSSNLVGLDDALQQLLPPINQIKEDIQALLSDVQQEKTSLSQQLQARDRVRREKQALQRFIAIATSVDKIEQILKTEEQEDTSKLIERVASELNQLQYYIEECKGTAFLATIQPRLDTITNWVRQGLDASFREALRNMHVTTIADSLKIYRRIGRMDDAKGIVKDSVVEPFMEQCVSRDHVKAPSDGLEEMYQKLLKFVRATCQQLHDAITQAEVTLDEMTDVVWPSFYHHLTTSLGFVFASGIADAFHHNYIVSFQFLDKLELELQTLNRVKAFRKSPLYGSFVKRWTLPVYFQLRFQEIAGVFETSLSDGTAALPAAFSIPSGWESLEHACLQALGACMHRCWQSSVLLQPLSHRFWKLTLQLTARLEQHMVALVASDVNELHVLLQAWAAMPNKVGAILRETALPSLALNDEKAESEIQDVIDANITTYTQIPSRCLALLAATLAEQCSMKLQACKTIPALFRHTGRPAPDSPSAYAKELLLPVSELLNSQSAFYASHQELKDAFCLDVSTALDKVVVEELRAVLDGIATLESSIQRIRKSKKKASGGDTMSDQDKIKLQLRLDLDCIVAQMSELLAQSPSAELNALLAELSTK